MKRLLLVLTIVPAIVLATEPVSPSVKYETLSCPQPVTPGCTATHYGLVGATCTQEDFVDNLPCMDQSYLQKMQYEENQRTSYPND